ncbi:PAS domain-containing protein [Halorhabdus salina]|uniref:PAS domain-containing protein n=1 Tax=Halorhabdus salina TaxID=2750670 RepID=UPI0015EEFCDE|nr:PAS domain-containing protein [Halorhabdus salina]
MVVATSPIALAASVIAILTSAAFVVTIHRYRDDPTTVPLIGVAITLLAGSLLHLFVVDLQPVRTLLGIEGAPTFTSGGLWVLFAIDIPAVVGGLWFLFALQYTGRDRETSSIVFPAIAVLLLALVALNVGVTVASSALSPLLGSFNALLGITIVLTEAVATIGIFLVLTTTLGRKAFPIGQIVSLTGAIGSILLLPFLATTIDAPIVTPLAVATAATLLTVTTRRYRLFETLPVASVVGRDRVIEEMGEGVLVIGSDGTVQDHNSAARTLFGLDDARVRGRPLDEIVPELPETTIRDAADSVDVETTDGRVVTANGDPLTNDRGHDVGYMIVCQDVTERRRRERRLGVLTQVVAGATSERLGTVADLATAVLDDEEGPGEAGDRIRRTATDVARLVERVRDVEQAVAERTGATAPIAVDDVIAAVRGRNDDITIRSPDSAGAATVYPELLEATVETLALGAGESPPDITVAIADDEDTVITISPFGREDAIADLVVSVAELAADEAGWRVDRRGDDPACLTLRLSSATRRDRRPDGGDSQ